MNYLYPTQILFLHKRVIDASGGSHGVREQGLLESAVYRPQEAMRRLLRMNGFELRASEDKKFDFAMKIASGEMDEHQMGEWLKRHCKALP